VRRRAVRLSRLDLPRIGIGAALAAGLGVGLCLAFLKRAEATVEPGPTAATLDEAFSAWLGAGLGLLLGSALCALLVRRGSRVLSATLAGIAAYALALVPLDVFTRPDDVALSEEVSFVLFMLPVAGLFALCGAAAGSALGGLVSPGRTP
jgi:hypothetical protein